MTHLYSELGVYSKTLFLYYRDLEDATTLRRILTKVAPDEIYNLAGQRHVGLSFEIPESTVERVAMGTLRLLEIIQDLPVPPRIFHATSSEIFGRPAITPEHEDTPMLPVSPYRAAKAFATQLCRIYREHYRLFTVNGILYNDEPPRRGGELRDQEDLSCRSCHPHGPRIGASAR